MRHIIFILFWGLTTTIQANTPSVSTDSIHTLKHVLKIHLNYPDSALQLLDSMEARQQIPPCVADAQRAMIYSGLDKYHQTINYAQKALTDDSLSRHPRYYLQAISHNLEAHQQLSEYKQCLQILQQGIAYARSIQNTTAEANYLFTAGQIYFQLNNRNEAFRNFQLAIRLAEQAPPPKLKPYLSFFYGELSNILLQEQRYEEALQLCHKREKLIAQLQTFPRIPLGYIDQQYAYLYSKQATILYKMNRKTESAASYRKFNQTQASQKPQGKEAILPYWLETGQFDLIIEYLTRQTPPADTINQNYAAQLATLAKAYQGNRQYEAAYHYQLRLTAINDSLYQQNKKEEIAELATLYQLREKELEIKQQQEQAQKALLLRNWMTGAFILTFVLLWTTWHHLRITQRKNKLMASSINTVLACEEKIEHLEKQISEQPPSREHEEEEEEEKYEEDEIDEYLTFKRIERIIKDEKLYLKPDLNRQEILDQLNMDKNHFARLMQHHLQMSLPQYLTELRIKHAIALLKDQPNYTIKAIADESGFNNLRNFQRIFKTKTGMTPTEYKTAINQKG